MRRMWAAGAAIVVCLALGGPVMAQEASPATDGPVRVTATQACGWHNSGEGVQTGDCTHVASDPRVTGPLTLTMAEQVFATRGNNDLATFDAMLEGPDGSWTGRYWIVFDWPANVAHAMSILTGDGAYDGWTYVAATLDVDPDGSGDHVGVIYQGAPPPGIAAG